LESNTWRNRFTILWCIDPNNLEFTSVETKWTCNLDLMSSLLEKIANKYEKLIKQWKRVYIILDNARYQKSYKIQELAEKLWIELVYLAPYCPHLNLIERLWKRLKSKLKNKYFEKFDVFCEYIMNLINNIWDYEDELKSLLTMNFQTIK
jgi:transposase